MGNIGIYIHIPFCVKKCNYCDFNSYARCYDKQDDYFKALISELSEYSKRIKSKVDTVYIGGGTPTSVKTEHIVNVMKTIKYCFDLSENAEITIECNPGTADKDALHRIRTSGINRISIGLQSTHEILLEKLGRIHSLLQFEECVKNAREVGFENISADLMFGLPDQTMDMWRETLKKVMEYKLEHISCYSLKIEEGTPFYNMKLNLPDDDLNADMYEFCVDFLKECGYERYEISNFAKKDMESRHNLKYWECSDFLGVGAGAYSCMEGKRYYNFSGIDKYINEINSKKSAVEKCDILTEFDKMSEFVFLGLRCREGISEKEFEKRFKKPIESVFKAPLDKYIKLGCIIKRDGTLKLSEKMLYLSNTILSDFV